MPILFVGRAAESREFGIFLIAYGALALAMATSRSMFGVVVGMDIDGMPGPDERVILRLNTGGVLFCAGASALILLTAAAVLRDSRGLVMLLGVAALLVLPQDLARYTAVATGRAGRALLVDSVWLVPSLIALTIDLGTRSAMSVGTGMTVWLAATATSLAFATVSGLVARPQLAGLMTWWHRDSRRHHLGADSILSGVVPVANGWAAAVVAGATAVAAVRGAAMLFAPVATLMLAMTLASVPEARRRGGDGAVKLLMTLTALLAAGTVAWGVLAVSLPDSVGTALIGDSWRVAEPVVPLVSLEYVGLALWAGGNALLRFRSATRRVLSLRVSYAPAAAVLPPVALWLDGDPRLFAAVLAALAWAVGVSALVSGLRTARSERGRLAR